MAVASNRSPEIRKKDGTRSMTVVLICIDGLGRCGWVIADGRFAVVFLPGMSELSSLK